MLKVCILGAGLMGNTHSICYDSMSEQDVKVTAVADIAYDKAAAVAGKFNARAYSSADELLDKEEADIIDICLPTFMHREYIIKSLNKGCHVLCEKPLALSVEEGREIMEIALKTDRKVMVAHCIRFWPEYELLKEYIENKTLGRFLSGVFTRISPRRKPGTSWEDWIVKEELSGSAVIDLHIHDVDFIRYILGEPDEYQTMLYYNHDNPEHVFTNYRFGRVVVSTEAGGDYPNGGFQFSMGYRAVFEKGTVIYGCNNSKTVKIYMENGEVIEPDIKYPPIKPVGTGGNVPAVFGYYNEIEYFINCVRSGADTEKCGIRSSFKTLELVHEIAAAGKKNVR